ncbi:MAG: hypothetical protein R3Y07_02560 [Eubacteriales bacterium]
MKVRIQSRLLDITEDASDAVFFCNERSTLQGDLLERIQNFVTEQPNTNLIIIDTLQMIRGSTSDNSYACDYGDLVPLKELAYRFKLAIVLIHHLKKQPESDKFNEISGTTGLQGVVDGMYVLSQSRKLNEGATLHCIGRDFARRELELYMNSDHVWEKTSDSLQDPHHFLSELMKSIVKFVEATGFFRGSATELSTLLRGHSDDHFSNKVLSKNIKLHKKELETFGIKSKCYKSNGQKLIELSAIRVDSVDHLDSCQVGETPSLSTLQRVTPTF